MDVRSHGGMERAVDVENPRVEDPNVGEGDSSTPQQTTFRTEIILFAFGAQRQRPAHHGVGASLDVGLSGGAHHFDVRDDG